MIFLQRPQNKIFVKIQPKTIALFIHPVSTSHLDQRSKFTITEQQVAERMN